MESSTEGRIWGLTARNTISAEVTTCCASAKSVAAEMEFEKRSQASEDGSKKEIVGPSFVS
jgi:hypothetical protein